MVFTPGDYHDFVELLAEHPEWRSELRSLVLSDELLSLPEIVRELAQAQQRTETHLEALTAQVQTLAQAQQRTETRLEALTVQVQTLAQAQQRTETRLEELTRAQLRTEKRVERLENRVGILDGRMLEWTYREKASAYFGRLLRRLRVVTVETLEDVLEERLTAEEFADLLLVDLVVHGWLRQSGERPEVWLVVEVSVVVDKGDVERAVRRAAVLRKGGYRAIPVVAGERATGGAKGELQQQKVVLVQDGRVVLWKEALETWAV